MRTITAYRWAGNSMSHIIYRFHCPLHGDEESVFCFRAFDKANRNLWVKFEMVWHQDSWGIGEFDELLRRLADPLSGGNDQASADKSMKKTKKEKKTRGRLRRCGLCKHGCSKDYCRNPYCKNYRPPNLDGQWDIS